MEMAKAMWAVMAVMAEHILMEALFPGQVVWPVWPDMVPVAVRREPQVELVDTLSRFAEVFSVLVIRMALMEVAVVPEEEQAGLMQIQAAQADMEPMEAVLPGPAEGHMELAVQHRLRMELQPDMILHGVPEVQAVVVAAADGHMGPMAAKAAVEGEWFRSRPIIN
ncbi:hypothetical protein SDC9_182920 [bioreactor metagenome]|uniref:Uncharacterized protein n=1 Tax=bioreactor metagenome TaxID=1076179 RepID=A0A645HAN4_9ZZZZ